MKTDSAAVMARRNIKKQGLDFYPTPPWAVRALMEKVHIWGNIWEPACGNGHISEVLKTEMPVGRDITVYSSDIRKRDYDCIEYDFLDVFTNHTEHGIPEKVDWIISNPPFNLATKFALRGLEHANHAVALICRTSWLESKSRYLELFKHRKPQYIYVFCERVSMVEGYVSKDASAVSYSWFIWAKNETPGLDIPIVRWIEPGTKKRLERNDDYR